jgi:SAM-dependent methyltransferase
MFRPYIRSLDGAHVLDLGCGMGGFAVGMAQEGVAKVIGIDIAPDRIRVAQGFAAKRGVSNIAFQVGDATLLPFREHVFDFVYSFYTFEHVAQPKLVLKELWRVLKPGGVLAMAFPTWYGPWAGHLYSLFPVPWLHLLFPEKALVQAWKQRYAERWSSGQVGTGWGRPDTLEDVHTLLEVAHANGITVSDFEALLSSIPVHPLFYQTRCIKGMQWLLRIPFIREFVVSGIFVAWQKRDSVGSHMELS